MRIKCKVCLQDYSSPKVLRRCPNKDCPSMQVKLPELSAAMLTPRETDVAKLLLCAFSNKEIGAALHISPRTVKSYLREMSLKAGLSGVNRIQLAMAIIGH